MYRLRGSKNAPTAPDLGNANVGIVDTPYAQAWGVLVYGRSLEAALLKGGVVG